jgi:TonB-dependent SusC/RagA subfamily outer membrane receptor
MYEYLRGRVTGVYIGPDNSIRIRGNNSINSSNEPLILLDGVEITDLGAVSPNDVYSVDVLKDASSSIYGMRGANGVILITTKGAHHAKEAAAEAKRQEKEARKAASKVRYDKK